LKFRISLRVSAHSESGSTDSGAEISVFATVTALLRRHAKRTNAQPSDLSPQSCFQVTPTAADTPAARHRRGRESHRRRDTDRGTPSEAAGGDGTRTAAAAAMIMAPSHENPGVRVRDSSPNPSLSESGLPGWPAKLPPPRGNIQVILPSHRSSSRSEDCRQAPGFKFHGGGSQSIDSDLTDPDSEPTALKKPENLT
jgi:hypothetical protein